MKISFYDTFIVQIIKITHFTQNNYKGIVLKIGVQNSLESAFMILLSSKTLKTLILPQIIIGNHTKNKGPKWLDLAV